MEIKEKIEDDMEEEMDDCYNEFASDIDIKEEMNPLEDIHEEMISVVKVEDRITEDTDPLDDCATNINSEIYIKTS